MISNYVMSGRDCCSLDDCAGEGLALVQCKREEHMTVKLVVFLPDNAHRGSDQHFWIEDFTEVDLVVPLPADRLSKSKPQTHKLVFAVLDKSHTLEIVGRGSENLGKALTLAKEIVTAYKTQLSWNQSPDSTYVSKFPSLNAACKQHGESMGRRKPTKNSVKVHSQEFGYTPTSVPVARALHSSSRSRGSQLVNLGQKPGTTMRDTPVPRYQPLSNHLTLVDSGFGSRPGQQTISSLSNIGGSVAGSLFARSTVPSITLSSAREWNDTNNAHQVFEQRKCTVNLSTVQSINQRSMYTVTSFAGESKARAESIEDEEEGEYSTASQKSADIYRKSILPSSSFKASYYTLKPAPPSTSYQSTLASYAQPAFAAPSALSVSRGELKGMRNIGNTCYMNAILQALFAQPSFVHDLTHIDASTGLPAPIDDRTFYSCLVQLAEEQRSANHGVIDTAQLKRAFELKLKHFAGYRQQDAHEFLTESLNHINEDILEVFKQQWKKRKRPFQQLPDANGADDDDSRAGVSNVNSPITIDSQTQVLDTQPLPMDMGFSDDWDSVINGNQKPTIVSNNGSSSDKENVSPLRVISPLPPMDLVREWDATASQLSPVQRNFHCAIKVTLTCANSECSHQRSNLEHFTVLSLDLLKQPSNQTTLDAFVTRNNANYSVNDSIPSYMRKLSPSINPQPNNTSAAGTASARTPPPTLGQLLKDFFRDTEREYRCEKCSNPWVHIQSRIVQLPRVLILHVKRFAPNKDGEIEKLTDRVSVSKLLIVDDACDAEVRAPVIEKISDAGNDGIVPSSQLSPFTEKRELSSPKSGRISPAAANHHLTPLSLSLALSSTDERSSHHTNNHQSPVNDSEKRKREEIDIDGVDNEHLSTATASSAASSSSPPKRRKLEDSFNSSVDAIHDLSVEMLPTPESRRSRQSHFQFGSSQREGDAQLRAKQKLHEHKMSEIRARWQHQEISENEQVAYLMALSGEEERYRVEKEQLERDITEAKKKRERELEQRRRDEREKAERLHQKHHSPSSTRDISVGAADLEFDGVDNNKENEADPELQAVLELSKKETRHSPNEEDEPEFLRQIREAQLASLQEAGLTEAPKDESNGPRIKIDNDSDGVIDDDQYNSNIADNSELSVPRSPASLATPTRSKPSAATHGGLGVYQLTSVVLHRGAFSSSGHYITDVCETEKGETVWRRYDDQFVKTLTSSEEATMTNQWMREGYIFFFEFQPSHPRTA